MVSFQRAEPLSGNCAEAGMTDAIEAIANAITGMFFDLSFTRAFILQRILGSLS